MDRVRFDAVAQDGTLPYALSGRVLDDDGAYVGPLAVRGRLTLDTSPPEPPPARTPRRLGRRLLVSVLAIVALLAVGAALDARDDDEADGPGRFARQLFAAGTTSRAPRAFHVRVGATRGGCTVTAPRNGDLDDFRRLLDDPANPAKVHIQLDTDVLSGRCGSTEHALLAGREGKLSELIVIRRPAGGAWQRDAESPCPGFPRALAQPALWDIDTSYCPR